MNNYLVLISVTECGNKLWDIEEIIQAEKDDEAFEAGKEIVSQMNWNEEWDKKYELKSVNKIQ